MPPNQAKLDVALSSCEQSPNAYAMRLKRRAAPRSSLQKDISAQPDKWLVIVPYVFASHAVSCVSFHQRPRFFLLTILKSEPYLQG